MGRDKGENEWVYKWVDVVASSELLILQTTKLQASRTQTNTMEAINFSSSIFKRMKLFFDSNVNLVGLPVYHGGGGE